MGTIVKALDNFNIDIYKLSIGAHDYQFEIDNAFFEPFPNGIVEKGSGTVGVTLDKSETLIEITFNIDVNVELECDRSLELFNFPIKEQKGLILKYGVEEKELDDEIIIIPKETQRINLAQHIYEYLGLAIPMKKLHPKYEGVETSDGLIYTSEEEDSKEENEVVDPRWEKLRKLK